MSHKILYPAALKIFRARHNEKEILIKLMDDLPNYCPHLQTATTCLSIGTGYGDHDIEFIKKCLPNLKRFISIEIDGDCVVELKANLENEFRGKFEVQIFHMTVEKFMDLYEGKAGSGDLNENTVELCKEVISGQIDVVMAIHVIHFLDEQARKRFYRICFQEWLKPGIGQLLFIGCSRENSLNDILKHLNSAVILASETIRDEMVESGATLVKELDYNGIIDYSKYDLDMRRFMDFSFKHSNATEESVAQAMKAVAPDGRTHYKVGFCIFQRTK